MTQVQKAARRRYRKWYSVNREKAIIKAREWARANPVKRHTAVCRWRRENPTKIQVSMRRYRRRNRTKLRQKGKEYYLLTLPDQRRRNSDDVRKLRDRYVVRCLVTTVGVRAKLIHQYPALILLKRQQLLLSRETYKQL